MHVTYVCMCGCMMYECPSMVVHPPPCYSCLARRTAGLACIDTESIDLPQQSVELESRSVAHPQQSENESTTTELFKEFMERDLSCVGT